MQPGAPASRPVRTAVRSMNEPVRCFSHEDTLHVIEPSGSAVVFKQAQRSSLLAHMAGTEGAFSLPVSHRGLNLFKEAGDSMDTGRLWSSRRLSDMGRVAEVHSLPSRLPDQVLSHGFCATTMHDRSPRSGPKFPSHDVDELLGAVDSCIKWLSMPYAIT